MDSGRRSRARDALALPALLLSALLLLTLRPAWSCTYEPVDVGMFGRGLHSSTFRLNLSAFWGIGVRIGVVRGWLGGVIGGIEQHQGVLRVYFVSETAQVQL